MKDIKTLYLFARANESSDDIKDYCEAVNEAFNNNHYEYVSNLEYIIPSGYGIKTFRKFIENNNLPIISYDNVMMILEDAIRKYSIRNLSSIYKENVDYDECKRLLESFKEKYKNSFMMFEAFNDSEMPYDDYLQLYYKGYFESNIPAVLTQFGEAAIPDVIISAVKNNRTDITFKFLSEAVESSEGTATYYQWLSEAVKDIKNPSGKLEVIKQKFTKESLDGIVKSIKLRNAILYKESVVMDKDVYMEYSEDDIKHMQDYIAFKEYYVTTLDNFDDIQKMQNEIISVYEEFDGLIDEDTNDLVDMLPGARSRIASEATIDKKYGDIPKYLKKHHDLSYGEDDDINDVSNNNADDLDLDDSPIDNYARAHTPKVSDIESDDITQPTPPVDSTKGVNNYYYTYNNSFNKNNRDSHDTLKYSVNGEKIDDINESYDPISIDNEIELILLEASELDTLFMEANTNAMGSVKTKDAASEGIIEKIKKLLARFIEFIKKMWDTIIPKTFTNFNNLSKKYLKSKAIIKYLKNNDGVLPIHVTDVNNMDIWAQLIKDADNMLSSGMVSNNINYDHLQSKDQVIIFFRLIEPDTDKDVNNYDGAFLVGSTRLMDGSILKRFNQNKKLLFKSSAKLLTQDDLLDVFTGASNNMIPTRSNNYAIFKHLLKQISAINTSTRISAFINKNKYGDAVDILSRMTKELTALSRLVHDTMTSAYRSAVVQLNNINDRMNSTDSIKQESAPWELDIFPSNKSIYESASSVTWADYYEAENESFKKIGGSILKDITSYFESNVEKTIKANPELKYLDDPNIIKEIKTAGKQYNDLCGNAEYLVFNGNQEYRSLTYKYFETELWETDKIGNFLIADLFLLMMKQFILDNPKYIEYFDIPLKYRGWLDEIDDIPGITISVKEPNDSINIRIGTGKFRFKTDAYVNVDNGPISSHMSKVSTARLLYFMNKSKIEDGEIGKSIMAVLKKYNKEINEDNLSKFVSGNKICFKAQGIIEFTFIDKVNKGRNIVLVMNPSLKLQKLNVINEGVDIVYDESTIMNESVMGVLGTVALTILAMPFVLAGGLIITAIVYMKIEDSKNKKIIQKVLSDILGNKVTNVNKYLTSANGKFNEFIDNKPDTIKKYFYKPDHGGFVIDEIEEPSYAWAPDKKIKDETDRLLILRNFATGIIERSKIPELKKKLKELSDDTIQFTMNDCELDLPGDDNGGSWSYLIDVGLINKGPEDMDENDDADEIYLAATNALEKYAVVDISIGMQVKKFLLNDKMPISESVNGVITESSEDEDPERPKSDHPIIDTLSDIDRKLTSKQQEVKKTTQAVINTGRVFLKPAHRTVGWINNVANQWKDRSENQIKERMADPRSRNSLYRAIRKAVEIGSLFKARLLFNPIFMFLTITKKVSKGNNSFRIRNEMIGELKAELEIIDEKIKDADDNSDNNAKYKLMRLKTEVNKKLLRVDGGKAISKIL